MNYTRYVAWFEARHFLMSPIAWVIVIVFLIHTGFAFFQFVEAVAEVNLAGVEWSRYTHLIFVFQSESLMPLMQDALMLYVPILTMGTFAREFQSGSIRLLLSSPVSVTQIVIGKFIALLGLLLLLMLILLLFGGIAASQIDNFDWGLFLSSLFGTFLLAITYASIGMYVSSKTTYQIVSVVVTIAILVLLDRIGSYGQRVPILGDFLYWLNLSGRVSQLNAGLISSGQIAYFISISVFFVFLTIQRFVSQRDGWSRTKSACIALVIVLVLGTVGVLSQDYRFNAFVDVSQGKRNSASREGESIINRMVGPWKVTVFINVLDARASDITPTLQHVREGQVFGHFLRHNHEADFEYVYYYAAPDTREPREAPRRNELVQQAKEFARQHRMNFEEILSPEEVEKLYDVTAERNRPFYIVQWNNRKAVARTFNDGPFFPSQVNVLGTLRKVVDGSATVGYSYGNGERSIVERSSDSHVGRVSDTTQRRSLENYGLTSTLVDLNWPVSEMIDVLVVAGPTKAYSETQLKNLSEFVNAGRNLFVMVDPDGHKFANQILGILDIESTRARLVEPKEQFDDSLIMARYSDADGASEAFLNRQDGDWPILLPGALPLNRKFEPLRDFDATPILYSETDKEVALALTRKQLGGEQRILVLGDADFMTLATLFSEEPRENGNRAFISEAFGWLTPEGYPVRNDYPASLDNDFDLTLREIEKLKLVVLVFLPLVLASIGGSILVIRRAR